MASLSGPDVLRILLGFSIMVMNFISLFVLFKCKQMAFQIRLFTTQLAAADFVNGFLFILLGLQVSSLSETGCRFNYYCSSVLNFLSIFTITAMAGDRFLALCFPFKYHYVATPTKLKLIALVLWVTALAITLVNFAWMDNTPFSACDYMEVSGKNGYRLMAVTYTIVIVLNVAFFAGIVWTLFVKKNAIGTMTGDEKARHIKDQKRILVKILGILGLFVLTYSPSIVLTIILGVDFEHKERYMTVFLISLFLGISNSVLSPLVYVWRYPECRYMFLIYCFFWNKGRQEKLREELNRYTATYNMATN